MSDVPLAHLYAETGSGPDADEELPARETSLEELTAETGAPEEISDSDVEELAVLILGREHVSDADVVELGLGEIVDGELALNRAGLRVVRRMLEKRYGDRLAEELVVEETDEQIVFNHYSPSTRARSTMTFRKVDR